MTIETCAEACSAVIGKPPSRSDLIEAVESCLVTGVTTPGDWGMLLGSGVGARLIPLLRDPRDGGVFGELLSGRSAIARGGDIDFPVESDDPVAPITPEAATLDDRILHRNIDNNHWRRSVFQCFDCITVCYSDAFTTVCHNYRWHCHGPLFFW